MTLIFDYESVAAIGWTSITQLVGKSAENLIFQHWGAKLHGLLGE